MTQAEEDAQTINEIHGLLLAYEQPFAAEKLAAAWNRTVQELEDQADMITALKAELDVASGAVVLTDVENLDDLGGPNGVT